MKLFDKKKFVNITIMLFVTILTIVSMRIGTDAALSEIIGKQMTQLNFLHALSSTFEFVFAMTFIK